ncbi:MAG: hypothetical protein DPW16_16040 [Chloroflexi bacterium]|nr:hypothetical protein [Chloroflexota bacterium]
MTATRESIREAFIAEGFSHIVDDLEPLMKDAIAIIGEIKQDDHEIPVGASKLGGAPDLPPNEQWPYWKVGEPLSFICQLNLAEATQHDAQKVLPTSGMLYFFCDVRDNRGVPPTGGLDDKGRWKFIYCNGDFSELRHSPFPQELSHKEIFAPYAVTFQQHVTIPSWHSDLRRHLVGTVEILDPEDVLFEHLERVYDQIEPNPAHQLLGHPTEIQPTDMRIMCQYAWDGKRIHGYEGDPQSNKELLTRTDEWRMLLQVDSTKGYSGEFGVEGGMCWADGGIIYLWMRDQDLIAGKFENAWLVLQDT